MYSALLPAFADGDSACHRCRTTFVAGDRAWRASAHQDGPRSLCLPCGRPFATGRPGASAEREALRRMRAEPVIAGARPAPVVVGPPRIATTGWAAEPSAISTLPTVVGDPHRWGRLAGRSLLVVLASSALTAAGPVGQVLGALIGFPAVAVFWMFLAAWPVSAVRASWRRRRGGAPRPAYPEPGTSRAGAAAPRPATNRPVRVIGGEDNWVKGVRGEQATGAVLDGTGLPVLHDRRLRRGSKANIDHVVVAADAVYVVDAKNFAGALTTAGGRLRIDGRPRDKLVDGVQQQADEIANSLGRLGVAVPVRTVLCLTGAAQPAGMQPVRGVLLTTPRTLASALSLPGPLGEGRRAEIADLVAWAFPPAVRA